MSYEWVGVWNLKGGLSDEYHLSFVQYASVGIYQVIIDAAVYIDEEVFLGFACLDAVGENLLAQDIEHAEGEVRNQGMIDEGEVSVVRVRVDRNAVDGNEFVDAVDAETNGVGGCSAAIGVGHHHGIAAIGGNGIGMIGGPVDRREVQQPLIADSGTRGEHISVGSNGRMYWWREYGEVMRKPHGIGGDATSGGIIGNQINVVIIGDIICMLRIGEGAGSAIAKVP